MEGRGAARAERRDRAVSEDTKVLLVVLIGLFFFALISAILLFDLKNAVEELIQQIPLPSPSERP